MVIGGQVLCKQPGAYFVDIPGKKSAKSDVWLTPSYKVHLCLPTNKGESYAHMATSMGTARQCGLMGGQVRCITAKFPGPRFRGKSGTHFLHA